ncbi:hypothetical protein [Streptomyces sp. NPDC057910]|uniref:hypothetical protein n=1 Tax=Streptomyces sp. NPDC057910 TaxID=3346278 RepID=UPI0036EE491A
MRNALGLESTPPALAMLTECSGVFAQAERWASWRWELAGQRRACPGPLGAT